MTEPAPFTSTSPRHSLPFLFSGQAQREFFINQGLAQLDTLLHPSVKGELGEPPVAPLRGDCWLIATGSIGAWAGRSGDITCWDGTQWLFVKPVLGMLLYDQAASGRARYDGQWRRIARPADPTGGATTDTQARAAIAALLDAMTKFGIFSTS